MTNYTIHKMVGRHVKRTVRNQSVRIGRTVYELDNIWDGDPELLEGKRLVFYAYLPCGTQATICFDGTPESDLGHDFPLWTPTVDTLLDVIHNHPEEDTRWDAVLKLGGKVGYDFRSDRKVDKGEIIAQAKRWQQRKANTP